jgi:zinc transporter ZupT
MLSLYFLGLFIVTIIGGSIPFWIKEIKPFWITLLLACSGSFLLGITLLHLVPETFTDLGSKVGIYIFAGFFLQFILQKFTHGVEHGHVCGHGHDAIAVFPILVGLSVHAFMEGIPLGYHYHNDGSTLSSIFMGVFAHKMPEAITLSSLLVVSNSKNKWLYLIAFALMSPLAGLMANHFGVKYYFVSHVLTYIIPVVAGAFLHISTTILFESGTQHHSMSKQKSLAILVGVGLALLTLMLD